MNDVWILIQCYFNFDGDLQEHDEREIKGVFLSLEKAQEAAGDGITWNVRQKTDTFIDSKRIKDPHFMDYVYEVEKHTIQ